MTIVVFSKDNRSINRLRDAVTGPAVEGRVEAFDDEGELMDRLLNLDEISPAAVFVDVAHVPHPVRLIKWLKLAPGTRHLKVVALGEESEPIRRVRSSWGSEAVLTTSLSVAAVRSVVMNEKAGESKDVALEPDCDAAAMQTISFFHRGILYVADNPADCHLFSTAIAQSLATFPLQSFESFAKVVGHLREKAESRRITSDGPCCLLLDTAAVGESTHEVIRWIRYQSSFPELLVVLLSETDEAEMVKESYRAGANYYLVKPKTFEGVTAIVNVIEEGLRQTPPSFHNFVQLPEYRDPLGSPVIPNTAGAECAQ
jgi:CheY-like chemotaxis protein